MIYIKKSKNADTRSATVIDKDLLEKDTLSHIDDVKQGLNFFIEELKEAGECHDYTKLFYLDKFFEDFSTKKTGEKFKALPWWKIHLRERHHINDKVPPNVNLLDVLEMIADGVMAGKARSEDESVWPIVISDEILQLAVKNTQELLERQIIVTGKWE